MTPRKQFGKRGVGSVSQPSKSPSIQPDRKKSFNKGWLGVALALIAIPLVYFNIAATSELKNRERKLDDAFNARMASNTVSSEARSLSDLQFGATTQRRVSTGGKNREDVEKLKLGMSKQALAVFTDCATRGSKKRLPQNTVDKIGGHQGIVTGETMLLTSEHIHECLSHEKPEIFCEAPARTFLVVTLKEYFLLHQKTRQEWKTALQEDGPLKIIYSLPKTQAEIDEMKLPSQSVSTKMTDGITHLASMGLVSMSDFQNPNAIDVPRPVINAIEGVEIVNPICESLSDQADGSAG